MLPAAPPFAEKGGGMPVQVRHGREQFPAELIAIGANSRVFDARAYEKVIVYLLATGHTITFQGSPDDGATWFDLATPPSGAPAAFTAMVVDPCPGFLRFAVTLGAGNVTLRGFEGIRSID